jgi:hypothetical protein
MIAAAAWRFEGACSSVYKPDVRQSPAQPQ